MDSLNNAELLDLSRVWELDGDLMRCRVCKRSLVASRDGEEMRHRPGCKNEHILHPWRALRAALGIEIAEQSTK